MWWRVECPDKSRCPALLRLSYLDNKVGSVSSCARRCRLCDSVVVPLVILWQLGFIQIETAQQDCGFERVYVCVIWMSSRSWLSHPPLYSLLTFNSGFRAKTEVIVGEWKIGYSKILRRRYKLINLSLPWDRAGMDSAYWIFKFLLSYFYAWTLLMFRAEQKRRNIFKNVTLYLSFSVNTYAMQTS